MQMSESTDFLFISISGTLNVIEKKTDSLKV